MIKISKSDVYHLALGSAVLGSGGGGNPFLGRDILVNKMNEFNIDYIKLENEVTDDDFIVSIAGMGSPIIGIEKIPSGREYYNALKYLEEYLKMIPSKLSSIEIGGINSIVPFIASLYSKIPVVDGDGEGRAFPELYMTTFHFIGLKVCPMSIVDERENKVIIEASDNYFAEKIARTITVRFGGRGYTALYSMNGEEYLKGAILGSVSYAMEVGRVLASEGLDGLLSFTKGEYVFKGKVVDVKRTMIHGFHGGIAKLEGLEEYKGEEIKIAFKNEYLLAVDMSGTILINAPDIVSLIGDDRKVITSDSLKYGIKANVIKIPINRKWIEIGGYDKIKEEVINTYYKLSVHS